MIILLLMPDTLINRKVVLTLCLGLFISFSIFFLLKAWEENNRHNEFNYKAHDHAAAIQSEFEHVANNVNQVRFLIEHQINIEHDKPNAPNAFMPMAEKIIMNDPSLLSILWALKQAKLSQSSDNTEHLNIIYLKKSNKGNNRISDLQVDDLYDQHVNSPSLLHQKTLITSLVHKDSGSDIEELNLIAPVASQMQSNTIFSGNHIGSLIVEMNINGMIEHALINVPVSAQDISLRLLLSDGTHQNIYTHVSRSRTVSELDKHTNLQTNISFSFADQQWQLSFEAAPKFLRTHPIVLAWISLAFSLLLTLFFTWYAQFTRRQTMLIEQQVVNRTQELEQNRNKLHRIIISLQDTYFQTNAEGIITDCSPSVFELIGYTEQQVIGTRMADYYTSQDYRDQLLKALNDSEHGKLFGYESKALHRDGSHIWISSNVQHIYDEQGNITGIEGTVRDISGKKQAEREKEGMQRQVEHTQRLESLGILAGGIAHDFNNILAAIMGNASLADHKVLDRPHDSKEHITKIIHASEKASALCQQMLAYAGKGRFIIESLNISVLVDEVTELLKVSIAPNVNIHYQLHDALPHIDGDKAQLQQLFMNFTTNANEAIHDHGTITISTGSCYLSDDDLKAYHLGYDDPKQGDYVYIAFNDTGCGMDAATISKIFDPFFTTKFTGRGLGMSAVLGIITGHKGLIQCDSKQAVGTTFTVLMPVSKHQPVKLMQDHKSSHANTALSGTILIIDDDEEIREVVQAMLEDIGCASISAADGEAGIALFKQHQDSITAIILDMTMPGMDGLSTFDAIKSIDPNAKVILSTGYSEHEASDRFNGKGLFGFLQKPYSFDQLQQQIADITTATRLKL